MDNLNVIDTNIEVADPRFEDDHGKAEKFNLGSKAEDVYGILEGMNRQQVIDQSRRMADITIPSVYPPLNYRVGDDLPGTNQSAGAYAVNNLASKIMWMAFPPGQPMMRLKPVIQKLQKAIDQNPTLYSHIELALSEVEMAHRVKAASIGLATAWVGYVKLLLLSGNALWKHIKLHCPTYHKLDEWVCSRDMSGHPLLTIHQNKVRLNTLDKDVQDLIMSERENAEGDLEEAEDWSREATIYCVCRFESPSSGNHEDGSWQYWEETEKGTLIPGTTLETDFDDCPMWPGWCIPVYGQNWGRSYCEEYRGDFYILESSASAINDLSTMASLALMFVNPGARTSLRQIQQAKNLTTLSGNAQDVTAFRTEKQADAQFVAENFSRAEQRIGKAFMITASAMRQGERVTAEEVERTGSALDDAMGGLYTEIAQSHQKRMVERFVHLNNEQDPDLPDLPPDLVKLEVITGVDSMGRSSEIANLNNLAKDVNTAFPPNSETSQILDPLDFSTRLASSYGIKPDGLVRKQQDIDAAKQTQQQTALQGATMPKVAGAAAGPLAKGMLDRMPPSQGQAQQAALANSPPSPPPQQQP